MKQFMLAATLLSFLLGGTADAQVKKAPDFDLKTADGSVIQLSKLKGKVVLLNFWATWCGPCRKEIPDFLEVYKEYGPKGFEIVGVALDDEGWTLVNPFVKQYKITYPVVIGNGKLVRAYGGFEFIPTTFLIDKEGNIVDQFSGLVPRKVLEKKLKELI